MASALQQRGEAILRRLPANAQMAEVGVLRGALSALILQRAPGATLLMVDNWLTADQQPEDYRATGDAHALHDDPARVAAHRRDAMDVAEAFGWRACIAEMGSIEAAKRVQRHEFDLVFLDADHSEAGVAADLEAWAPLVKAGGWIGGHDYGNADPRYDFSGVKRAVDAWVGDRPVELDLNFTWWVRL